MPKTPKTISRTSIRLPQDIHEELRVFAQTHEVTRTEAILTALSHYLDSDWGMSVTGRITDVEKRLDKAENQLWKLLL